MTGSAILAIDQGTTSSRAILFSQGGDILDVQQKELMLHCPHKGWVEQDPHDLWNDTLWACRMIVDKASQQGIDIAAIGITNQRETTIVWDRHTGHPVYNAIVWQDRRTADICARLKSEGHEEMVAERTGLLLDPYFSATKIRWILDHVDGARERAERGELLFGTVDSYLIWKLTGGAAHVTDATNASRTMLYNIVQQKWDPDLLALFDIPSAMLPRVCDSVGEFGRCEASILGRDFVIGGVAGDQQAALIGQGCFQPGMVKSTYGTGCFALMNIGGVFRRSRNRLLTTVAYRIAGKTIYAIEGSIFVAGAAIQWLRDGLGAIESSAQSEALALSVPDANEVYFVPAFTGLGAPYWRPEARGAILGLSRESTRAHIVRAALEAQGFQTLDLMAAMAADGGSAPAVIRADGGLVKNGFMCQFLSDMLQKPVEIPHNTECTAWGAACLAGLQTGLFSTLDEISGAWALQTRYEPAMAEDKRAALYAGWRQAVQTLLRE
jgi:glycerol kinase